MASATRLALMLILALSMTTGGYAKDCSMEFFFCGGRLQFEPEIDTKIASMEQFYVDARSLTFQGAKLMHHALILDRGGSIERAVQSFDDGMRLLEQALSKWDEAIEKTREFADYLPGKIRPEFARGFAESARKRQALGEDEAVLRTGFEKLKNILNEASDPEDGVVEIFREDARQLKDIKVLLKKYIDLAMENREFIEGGNLYETIYLDSLLVKHEKHPLLIANEQFYRAFLRNCSFVEAASSLNMDVVTRLRLSKEEIKACHPAARDTEQNKKQKK